MGVGKRGEEKGKLSSLSIPPLSVLFLCSRLSFRAALAET